jgi:hypothetical protein
MLIPALRLAEKDRKDGALTPSGERSIVEGVQRMLDEPVAQDESPVDIPSICVASAREGADYLAAQMLARLLPAPQAAPGHPQIAPELLEAIEQRRCELVLISAMQPPAATHAESLCRRLRQRFPGLKILVGLWAPDGDVAKAAVRLKAAGADAVVTTLRGAIQRLREQVPEAGEALARAS